MQLIFNIGLLIISAGYIYLASKMPFGTLSNPGPSFFSLIAGVLAFVLTLGLTIKTVVTSPTKISFQFPQIRLPNLKQGERFLPFLLGMILYTPLLKIIGFEIDTFLLSVYLMKVTSVKGWLRPIIYSAIVVVACHFVFRVWLEIPLP